jgi:hypothetical protein
MPRRAANPFTTVRSEGALLPPELLQRISDGDRTLGGLNPTDYHLGPTERIGEAISRSWNRLVGLWAAFSPTLDELEGHPEPGTTPTRERWLLPLFSELGFGRLQVAKAEEIDGKTYPVSHRSNEGVPIHLVGAGVDPDVRTAGIAGAAKMSPHGLVQELLNRTEALWGIISNGRRLRLLRDNASLTRQAYLEFDLEAMMAGEVYADFTLLWLTCHQSRFEAERPAECWLERWNEEARKQGTRVREALRGGVEEALKSLGAGFLAHPSNAELRERLRTGSLDTHDYYRELLRLVYRLIFLFVAEDRDLLHAPGTPEEGRNAYANFYSTARLRSLAERRRGTKHPDLYEGLKVVMASLGDDEGCPPLGLPALGGFLFSGAACPDLDRASIANVELLGSLRALAFTTEGKVLRPVDYGNIGSEELGSIYESLLELHPEIDAGAAVFSLASAAGNERKTTGSYYTPTPLISALLDSALDPVLAEAASRPLPDSAILNLKVLDPACGSGHFLVAAAHRIARKLAAVRTGEDEPSPLPYRKALRDVISHCVYGVDVNPMAVELCKVSLWMEAVEPGKPLSFLDHHILCGNSLLGTTPKLLEEGVPDEAFTALEGDDKKVVSELKRRNREERKGQQLLVLSPSMADLIRPLIEGVMAIEEISSDNVASLHEQEKRWAELERSDAAMHAKLVADAWCASFVIRKRTGAPVLTHGVLQLLRSDPRGGDPALHKEIRRLADEYRFLHPHLAFPGVYRVPEEGEEADNEHTGWSDGFDLVLGNPPWERVKIQEKEWFATRHPQIAEAENAAARKSLIESLATEDPLLYEAWAAAQRHADGESHLIRNTGRYPAAGRGDVNTYAIFTEAARDYMGPLGRTGLVVPTGLATDDTTKVLFGELVEHASLVSLYDFVNDSGLFPGVGHGRQKFCLLTLAGKAQRMKASDLVFFAHLPHDLEDEWRHFTLAPEDFLLLNPNTRTCPVFATRADAELTKRLFRRAGVLIDEAAGTNPWGVSLSRMYDMANASRLFKTRDRLESDGWTLEGNIFRRGKASCLPLLEGKMIHQFTARFGDYSLRPPGSRDSELPPVPHEWLRDPDYAPMPQYWVDAKEFLTEQASGRSWFLVVRRFARSTDERTVISAHAPVTALADNLVLVETDHKLGPLLPACLNSFPFDYAARQKLGGTNLSHFILKQLPVLPPAALLEPTPWDPGGTVAEWLAPRVLELGFVSSGLAGLARDLGWDGPPFRWDVARRAFLRGEVDAAFFHLYGLTRDEVAYVTDTFPIVRKNEERRYGEYRTKNLVLDRYRAFEQAIEAGEPYKTPLDPIPGDPSVAHDSPALKKTPV